MAPELLRGKSQSLSVQPFDPDLVALNAENDHLDVSADVNHLANVPRQNMSSPVQARNGAGPHLGVLSYTGGHPAPRGKKDH